MRTSRPRRWNTTLDRDVAAKLRDEMARTGTSMKDVVNAFLRAGLESPREEDLATPFTVKARPMDIREGFDIDDIGGLLDLLDGAARR